MDQFAKHHMESSHKSVLLILCTTFLGVCPKLEHSPFSTGTFLQGPTNQSVQLGQSCRFHCRIQSKIHSVGTEPKWPEAVNDKQLHVQWIIDGFGVTNETLRSIYDERYHMPGPMDEGIYDLVISNVKLDDEATFICQANVKLYRVPLSPVVETLASQPVHLNVVVPPTAIMLQKHNMATKYQGNGFGNSGHMTVTSRITIAWNNSTSNVAWKKDRFRSAASVVADDPESLDKTRNMLVTNEDSTILPNYHQIANHSDHSDPSRTSNQPVQYSRPSIPVIWTKENEQLTLNCQTTSSKPAAEIAWVLDGIYLDPKNHTKRNRMFDSALSSMLWHDASHNQHQRSNLEENFEIENIQFTVPLEQELQSDNTVGNKETETENVMLVTASTLRLMIQRHHQKQLLQCRISNADDFLANELPTVSAIIEPMYVDKIQIALTNGPGLSELREGTSVDYRCSARTNPPSHIYQWRLIRPNVDQTVLGEKMNYSSSSAQELIRTNDSDPSDPSRLRLRLSRDMHQGRLVCWIGVRLPTTVYDARSESGFTEYPSQPGESDGITTWGKAEQEIHVLYGALFEHITDNLRATKIGHTTTIDCSADANPSAQISLYRVGEKGQQLLERISTLQTGFNQTRNQKYTSAIHASQSSEQHVAFRNELSPGELANAIKSKGSQILASATNKISYPLQIKRVDDFGFYVCVARNPGFPPALRHVFIGATGPPKIVHCRQIQDRSGQTVELYCLIQSIPRPKIEQIRWIRKGVALKSNERLHIYQEQLIRGTRTALHFRKFSREDISEYNCTVLNDYGTDWQIVVVSGEANLPLVFVIGSGAATVLAIIFVTIIGCFIRHTRMRSSHLNEPGKAVSEREPKSNGIEMRHSIDCRHRPYEMQMLPMAQSITAPSTISDGTKEPMCHFCLTAQNPAFLDTQLEMDDAFGGGIAVNCKKSDDSGYEPGDVVSISAGLNDPACREHAAHNLNHDVSSMVGTMLLRNSPVVCYSTSSQYNSTLTKPQFGSTFINLHASPYLAPMNDAACSQQQTNQEQQTQLFSQLQYGSHYNSVTCSRPVMTRPLSPIFFMSPTVPPTNGYGNPVRESELILPQVLIQPGGLITSPTKCVSSSLPSALSQSGGQQSTICGPPVLTASPDIFPNLSVLPLNFTEPGSSIAPTTLTPTVGITAPTCGNLSEIPRHKTHLLNSRSSDEDGTNV